MAPGTTVYLATWRSEADHVDTGLGLAPDERVVEEEGLALSLGALARLAQDEEPGGIGGEARRGRGLGQNDRA
jgi:hypothetical protein